MKEDVSGIRRFEDSKHDGIVITEANIGDLPKSYLGKKHFNVSEVHPVERLPKEFVGRENQHCGSHQFLVVDFLDVLSTGKLAPNNVWLAARYNAPGIVAHESAKREGELLKVPDFGMPPKGASYLDPLSELAE